VIISRTPFRLSFFGGGTDYPAWYRKHSGAVLATTIDKYCYIMCRYRPPFFEHKYCVIYSKAEYTKTVDAIAHPAVREILRYLGCTRGMEIHHDADLPARSGMGSSSAFTVGLLHAMYALMGRMPTKKRLATESIHLEQNILKETVGSQDQALAAHGGLNHMTFLPNGEIEVVPMTIGQARVRELNDHLMLFYTGIARTASTIAQSYVEDMDRRQHQLRFMADQVDEAVSVLNSNQDITAFGKLLREAWLAKRSLSAKVSNPEVDEMFAAATSAGAIGGKLSGAGGGGFLLLFVPPARQAAVRERLRRLIHVPFRFDFTGSQIIFHDEQPDYSAEEEARKEQLVSPFRELHPDPA
jgi:D-glycero-alpha-D-manno-heptose-7-phosphate kinase